MKHTCGERSFLPLKIVCWVAGAFAFVQPSVLPSRSMISCGVFFIAKKEQQRRKVRRSEPINRKSLPRSTASGLVGWLVRNGGGFGAMKIM